MLRGGFSFDQSVGGLPKAHTLWRAHQWCGFWMAGPVASITLLAVAAHSCPVDGDA